MSEQPLEPLDLLSARVARQSEQVWIDLEPGVRFTVLRTHDDGGVTTLTRFEAGVVGGWHDHPGGEDLFVLEGELQVAGQHLAAGDFMHTPPGGRHRVEAITSTLLLVTLPQLPVYD